MKKIYVIALAAAMTLSLTGCNDFLDYTPTAVVDEDKAFSDPEKMVNSAYAMLGDCWYSYPFNLWPYGDLASDDCLKGGGGTGDTGYHDIEVWSSLTSTRGELDELWYRLFCAVSRCNRALVSLEENGNNVLGGQTTTEREAEVRFLRAHFYFKLISVFRQVPWIDEQVYKDKATEKTSNTQYTYEQLFGKVIDDFKFAYDNLPEKQSEGGRANKIAAAAYLAKCYLTLAWGDGYEATDGVSHINKDYMQKVVDYTDVVKASHYGYLEDYGDIFLPDYKNSKESIFAVQASDYSEDHTRYGRANWSNTLNGCWGIWSCGWDFHKPSQNLVNAYKTRNGLPEFTDYNDSDEYPVNGKPTAQKWDPRLFHTVGMPTFPYKYEPEYTLTKANSRTPNTYGYYTSMKEVPQRSKGESYNRPWQAFDMNDYVLRYTDVMLMRAEALIELGRLQEARTIINDIRQRAKNSIKKHIEYAADQCDIALYPESYFQDKETARKCLRWERRLEMGMEGSRFFDLRRWGIASETLNNYFKSEAKDVYDGQPYAEYYKDANFTPGKNEFWPVPYNQLYYIPGLYTQNKGYDK
ncbi:MAG TPA: RagB/SusD family nutrient uptake outer membrane protein [Prevotella sp.]|uniref:RagB/SusD family nutrient uptake outer membrane protein n=1 Tax=Hallella absiana TaxID=2925336 RepID=UPI000ED0C728|nr:RagB/SusD family nutrient uptake outer membrane protein [Hallella absiana]MDD5821581.1 RagB/SusD family nutrient uptake outer membrane protein [Prevotella sp.]HCJ47082.1 RagB/SusD family nutrient uptake outer membrane protein [Prevotella sp.]